MHASQNVIHKFANWKCYKGDNPVKKLFCLLFGYVQCAKMRMQIILY